MAELFPADCVLCDKATTYTKVKKQGGNELHYDCKEDNCGDYIISKRAIRWIKQSDEFKRRGSAMARKYNRGTEEILKIIYGAKKDEAIPFPVLRDEVNW